MDNLKKLNYSKPLPTVTAIHVEILEHSMYAVAISMVLNALQQVENTADADLSSLIQDTEIGFEFRKNLAKLVKYNEKMKYLLDYYDRKGFLN